MLLPFFISERPGLYNMYFRIHSSWKKIKESPPLLRFSIDLYSSCISASTALNSCYFVAGTLLILCCRHRFMSVPSGGLLSSQEYWLGPGSY